jgi:menaquinone-dependent protoporphyrinogen oxidase
VSSRILIVYGSKYGQAAKIANRIGTVLRQEDVEVTIQQGDQLALPAGIQNYDGIMVGASLIAGHYQKYIRAFVNRNHGALHGLPSAFFAVSGSAGGTAEEQRVARARIDAFLQKTQWKPSLTASFAGGIAYSRYNPLLRWFMHRGLRKAGRAIDATRDYEYTDWLQVDQFAHEFNALVQVPVRAS